MALYRKYRPASFQELVGQEQVTRPLSAALDSGRINHAYLFSGPRGCGKTSSARILARSLNCVHGPTSTPCGECHSCIALAPNGPGTVDVIELDAASNNGVEDMRELRDRAIYAPAESRYRIFIIDEAHMISNSGANALLKTVEEPPEHLIFIFATTEPEKVIGTIRSRTHHYPFRLLTPLAMRGLLERTMEAEHVPVDPDVYPLVISAGGGSPRDTLSVLDQLLSGSGPEGLTYDLARLVLGVTDESLLDEVVKALAEQDKAKLFHLLDDVIESGTDPRRFASDLLDRLRDLLMLSTVPDAFSSGLVTAPEDRRESLVEQAQSFETRVLTGLASTVQDGLLELRGATSPRLLLEILSAKLLLIAEAQPEATPSARARRPRPAAAAKQATPETATAPDTPAQAPAQPATATPPAAATSTAPASGAAPDTAPAVLQETRQSQPQQAAPQQPAPQQPAQESGPAAASGAPSQSAGQAQAASAPAAQPAAENAVQQQWNQILKQFSRRDKAGWVMLMQARLLAVRDNTVYLGHPTGALKARLEEPSHIDPLTEVIAEVTGQRYAVQFVVGTDPKVLGAETAPIPAAPQNAPAHGAPKAAAPQTQSTHDPAPSQAAQRTAPEAAPPEPRVPQAASEQRQADSHPTEAPSSNATWGAPAPLGNDAANSVAEAEEAPAANPAGASPEPAQAAQPSADPAPPGAAAEDAPPQKSALQLRMERSRRLAAQHRAEMAKYQFSDGTPLPPEPEPDPGEAPAADWNSRGGFASTAPATAAPDAAAPASAAPERAAAPAAENSSVGTPQPAAPGVQSSGPQASARPGTNAPASQSAAPTQPAPQAPSTPQAHPTAAPEASTSTAPMSPADQEAEMMHEASYGSGQRDHRNPLDVAVDVVTSELGGRRV